MQPLVSQSNKTRTTNEQAHISLLLRVAEQDKLAFESLYQVYHNKIYRFSFRVLGNSKHADDVVNDTMFVVWKKAVTYDHSCKLSTWILGIAYNKARKYFSSQAGVDQNEHTLEPIYDSCPLKIFEQQEWLEAGLVALSSEQRTVFELTYYYELHYREIADVMNCSENTVKTRMFYARRKLTELMKEKS